MLLVPMLGWLQKLYGQTLFPKEVMCGGECYVIRFGGRVGGQTLTLARWVGEVSCVLT